MVRNCRHVASRSLLAAAFVFAFAACGSGSAGPGASSGSSTQRSDTANEDPAWMADAYPVVDGLHVTGTPVAVDLATYRLEVVGEVDRPLSLSYDEVRALPSERSFVRLVCPGFFEDEGHWTGASLKRLLEQAGVHEGAHTVQFVAADGGYRSNLTLQDALSSGALIAYEFDDRPFPKVHGFPLRLVAPGQAGSVWVKWLGRIVVE